MRKWFSCLFGGRANNKDMKKTGKGGAVKKNGAKNQQKKGQKGPNKGLATKSISEKTPRSTLGDSLKKKSGDVADQKATQEHFGSRLTAFNSTPTGHTLYDVAAYLIHCKTHNKVAIASEPDSGYVWLPFISLSSSQTFTDGAVDGAYVIISGGEPNLYVSFRDQNAVSHAHPMELFRFQLPQTQKLSTRMVWYVNINPKTKGFKCCADTTRLKWVPVADLTNKDLKNLWGPEVWRFAKIIVKAKHINDMTVAEYSLDDAFKYVPRDPPRNLEEEMLKSTNFSEKDVERLYSDFIEHCFPSFFMTKSSFSDYMSKYGFEKMDKKLSLLFRAFNFNKDNHKFLDFYEFLLGLTSIDPTASNGQSRIKFLFKYFDVDGDGFLNEKEFTSMIRELNLKDSDADIKKKVAHNMKKMKAGNKGVFFDDFFKAVGSHQFRGTSTLCRSNRPILSQISRSMATRSLKRTIVTSVLSAILDDRKYTGVCESCREKQFEYATHRVRINAEGHACDAEMLPELSKIEKPTKTKSQKDLQKTPKKDTGKSKGDSEKSKSDSDSDKSKSESDSDKSSSGRLAAKSSSTSVISFSMERFSKEIVWNPKSVANYFIEQIRAFNLKKGTKDQKKGLFDSEKERAPFVQKLKELCNEMEKILLQEDRCVKVSSPAFIIGDIHGNLEDLLTMEKVLWKSLPITAANLVFLGDYVDRGQWGLECALYIMCMKLLAPHKVVILRGNHEVIELQKKYSYKKECSHKYGSLGSEVFDVTNKVFAKLPFSAIIDDAIFCAHGGIPCSTRDISKINEQPADLPDPERQSSICWEILWSDPIGATQFVESAELLQVRVETARGFLSNQKRGTAYLFAEEAANTFLQTNGLTHIVRAHEVPANGYTFHFGNKCVTIFSCSHYCGNNNEAAVIHVDNEKLRVVRLDTVNNAAAS